MKLTKEKINIRLAEIAFALGYSRWPLIRRVALTVATRSMFELHENGYFPAAAEFLSKVCKRFNLGNYREAARQYLNNV